MRSDSASVPAVPDRRALLERVGGDHALFRKLIGLFLAECPRLVARIEAALAAGNAAEVSRAAHALKGAVGNFEFPPALEAALSLETLAAGGDLASAPPALTRLQNTLDQLKVILVALAAEGDAS
jgi:HPt (histidine-containing phosphotransfer) domain-containing protein